MLVMWNGRGYLRGQLACIRGFVLIVPLWVKTLLFDDGLLPPSRGPQTLNKRKTIETTCLIAFHGKEHHKNERTLASCKRQNTPIALVLCCSSFLLPYLLLLSGCTVCCKCKERGGFIAAAASTIKVLFWSGRGLIGWTGIHFESFVAAQAHTRTNSLAYTPTVRPHFPPHPSSHPPTLRSNVDSPKRPIRHAPLCLSYHTCVSLRDSQTLFSFCVLLWISVPFYSLALFSSSTPSSHQNSDYFVVVFCPSWFLGLWSIHH